jgi:putative transposase
LRDHDSKFTRRFDAILEAEGIEVNSVEPKAPKMNRHAERFVQSARTECLDHFVFFGEKHLRYVLNEWLTHYNTERPHQGVGNAPLSGEAPKPAGPLRLAGVVCEERLSGLLKHYRRAA